MAHEVPRERIYGNFRPDGTGRKKRRNSFWRERRKGMSSKHCEALRQCPCATCPAGPETQVHHLKTGPARPERGASVRSTDRRAIPECWRCHYEIERRPARELEFYQARGIGDPYDLAEELWAASPDIEKMTAIIKEAKS